MALEDFLKSQLSLDAEKRKYAVLLLAALFILGGGYYLVSFAWDNTSRARLELQKQQQEWERLQAEVQRMAAAPAHELEEAARKLPEEVPTPDQLYIVQDGLAQISAPYELEGFSMRVGAFTEAGAAAPGAEAADSPPEAPTGSIDQATRDLLYVPIDISFSSSFSSLGAFLHDLSKVQGLISIGAIEVKRQGTRLFAQLSLRAFFRKS